MKTPRNPIALRSTSIATCAAVLTLGAFLFSGCNSNSPAEQVSGTWLPATYELGKVLSPKASANIPKSAEKLLALNLTRDGKFSMSSMIRGTYQVKGNDVTLHATAFEDRALEGPAKTQDVHATVSLDGKSLTLIDNGQTMLRDDSGSFKLDKNTNEKIDNVYFRSPN